MCPSTAVEKGFRIKEENKSQQPLWTLVKLIFFSVRNYPAIVDENAKRYDREITERGAVKFTRAGAYRLCLVLPTVLRDQGGSAWKIQIVTGTA